jgi:hypothetical protein
MQSVNAEIDFAVFVVAFFVGIIKHIIEPKINVRKKIMFMMCGRGQVMSTRQSFA